MGEITKNMDNKSCARAFEGSYRVIANEATKAGAGSEFDGSDSETRYNNEKNLMLQLAAANAQFKNHNISLQDAYDTNNFTAITNLLDEYLAIAAAKIGNGVTADDLRQVVNIAMTTEAMGAMHERSKVALNHNTNDCVLNLDMIKLAIDPTKYYTMLNRQQDNGRELC